MIRFLINEIEANPAPIITGMSERRYYSEQYFGYLHEFAGSISLGGQYYRQFYEMARNEDCDEIKIEIQDKLSETDQYRTAFYGVAKLSDVIFDNRQRTIDLEIVDDGVASRIINNFDIPINLLSTTTKNGFSITPNTQLINVTDQKGDVKNIRVMSLFESLKYCILYITDNSVGFQSDYLLSNIEASIYNIVGGRTLRSSTVVWPTITLQELLIDTCKLFNMKWFFIRVDGKPTIKLEPSTFFEQVNKYELNNFDAGKISSREISPSVYSFGSTKSAIGDIPSTNSYYIPQIAFPWSAHSPTEIVPDGQCNSDQRVDLSTGRIIVDTNTISVAMNIGTDEEYDKDFFLVHDSTYAFYIPTLGITKPINNFSVTNTQVLKRHLYDACFSYPHSESDCDTDAGIEPGASALGLPLLFVEYDGGAQGCYWDGGGTSSGPYGTNPNYSVSIDLTIVAFNDPVINGGASSTIRIWFEDTVSTLIFNKEEPGWTGGGGVPIPGYREFVQRTLASGETATFKTRIDYIPIFGPLRVYADSGIGSTEITSILEDSRIKIRPNSYPAFDDAICNRYGFKIETEGYLSVREVRDIRESPFMKLIFPTDIYTYTARILELNRDLINGSSKITGSLKMI